MSARQMRTAMAGASALMLAACSTTGPIGAGGGGGPVDYAFGSRIGQSLTRGDQRALGDVFVTALQSGAIDGTEWVGPWNDQAFGFYREAKYYYWPGFHEPGSQLALGVNLKVWDSFTAQEKAIVKAACAHANHLALAEFGHFNGVALAQLVNDHGVELRQMPDDVMAAIARESKTVLEEIAATDDISRRIFESYKASLQRSQEWARISDEAFMGLRRKVFSL